LVRLKLAASIVVPILVFNKIPLLTILQCTPNLNRQPWPDCLHIPEY
jgi:hypothetical protein